MPVQTAFNGGEISPQLYGRGDIAKYATSCRTLLNMICTVLGPATRRPGFEYIDSTKDSTKKAVLLDFEFSITQAYILEFGDLYIRFYKDGAQIDQSLANATAWATPVAYAVSDIVKHGGAIYRCISAHTSDGADEPGVGGNWATYWVQEDVYEIASPYTEDDLAELDIAQSGDVVYIAHPDFSQRELIRFDHDNWTIGVITFAEPPFLPQNLVSSNFIKSSAVTGSVTLTAVADTFTADHIGAYWKFYEDIASLYDAWLPSTVVAPGAERIYGGNLYSTLLGGTTGTRPPVHTEGDGDDGTVNWTYLHSGTGYAQITGFTSTKIVTATVISRLPSSVLNYAAAWDENTLYAVSDVAQNGGAIYRCVLVHPSSAWAITTTYVVDEIVTNGGTTYRCISAHLSSATNEPGVGGIWTNYWVDADVFAADEPGVGADWATYWVLISAGIGVYTWYESVWSPERGFPRAVSFDTNDRLWWAGSEYRPQSLWGSKVDSYKDHSVSDPLRADDALDLKMGSKKANAIRWIQPTRNLAVGTTAAEYWVTDATGNGPITPLSKNAAAGSAEGSSGVTPVAVGNVILFLQRHGKIVHELKYAFDSDSNVGAELTVLAEHLTRVYGIVSMAYQKEPHRILWCVRSDGTLLGLTYYPSQEVAGWHRHTTNGEVESVAVIPGTDEDEVWIVVKREIEGSDVRYVERMHSTFKTDDLSDAFFVDSGLTLDNRQTVESIAHVDPGVVTLTAHGYLDTEVIRFRSLDKDLAAEASLLSLNNEEFTVFNKTANTFELKDSDGNVVDLSLYKQVVSATTGKNVTSISGLSHLEGETVKVLADGAPVADKTVTSGAITLSRGASVVHVGMGYNSDLTILPPIAQDSKGQPALGEIKRYSTTTVMLDRSLGIEIGADVDSLTPVPFADDTVPEGRPADLFSGYIDEISVEGAGPKRENQILYRQPQPLPLTIKLIKTEVQ